MRQRIRPISHLRESAPVFRTVEQCMDLSDAFSTEEHEFMKKVSFEEMHDLWCRGKTIIFSSVPGTNRFFKPVRLCRNFLMTKKLDGLTIDESKLPQDFDGDFAKLRLKTIIEAIVRPNILFRDKEIHYFVLIPVAAKRAPHHTIAV